TCRRIAADANAVQAQRGWRAVRGGEFLINRNHTQVGHFHLFRRLWQSLKPVMPQLRVLAISCPDHPDLLEYLRSLYQLISPLACDLIWQTDGRPMSGDLGKGATRATVKLAHKVLQAGLPGYVQLAGGTNHHTIAKLQAAGLLHPRFMTTHSNAPDSMATPHIAGVAYGSFARKILVQVQTTLEAQPAAVEIEAHTQLLYQALILALGLVSQLKPQLIPDLESLSRQARVRGGALV
ncbi:MAG: hypothetical protein HC812_20165, partial [Leptolyngbya sp. RL_3_1]|nr:hypothetical protein [Leptolyngbya sp. RL_3_1]